MNRVAPISAALALVVALSLAPSAGAAPPSPAAVIALAAAASPDPVAPAQVTYLEVPQGEAPPRTLLRITVGADGQLREDVQDLGPGGATVVRIWAPPGAGAPAAGAIDEAPAWLRLLVGHPLERVLATMGVDTTRAAFARDGRELLWVLGAGPQAPDAPQIHVSAATGQLRRVTERAPTRAGDPVEGDAAAALTIRLSAPRVVVIHPDDHADDHADAPSADPPAPIEVSSAPWPERITLPRPGLPPLVLALNRVSTEPAHDPELFVPELLPPGSKDTAPDEPAVPPAANPVPGEPAGPGAAPAPRGDGGLAPIAP